MENSMDHLKMHSLNKIDENVSKIARIFPNCVTEAKDENGEITHKIDFDMLKQELSHSLVEGREERYQFTWPDKKQAIFTANAPINKTLRPCREESVNFDETENLYIEGDNLEVLKLLQETYLGKIKMIYIDPPYNTGNDFVYNDDFRTKNLEFRKKSGNFDEEGKQLVDNYTRNTESNGRFHTDWLNMMYPRLKLARDLLSDDGVIFISIDDNEIQNLHKLCDEVFGESNLLTCVTRSTGTPTGGGFDGLVNELDYMLIYAKNINFATINGLPMTESDAAIYDLQDEKGRYLIRSLRRTGGEDRREDRPTMYYPLIAPDGTEVYPIGPTGYESRWICSQPKANEMEKQGLLEWKQNKEGKWTVYQKFYLENRTKAPGNLWTDVEGNKKATKDIRNIFDTQKVFDFPKPVGFLKKAISIGAKNDSIILDFFSGSATTAHSIMQLNSEDGGNRKYIMVQVQEETAEDSEAYKIGYKNICEIGKERIRRAGKKIIDEHPECKDKLDIGFRVLKIDSTNMEDVYYTPDHIDTNDLFKNNIKSDRTGEDLLFQTMLDLGIMLSSKIETKKINGKEVFCVEGNYLMACFDDSVDEKTITEIAKEKPYYFVMRDPTNSKDGDSLITNFEQIFTTYSPDTVRKIL